MDLKIGDVVQLASGGPSMTIEKIDEDGVQCVWFVGKDLKRAVFGPNILRKPQAGVTSMRLSRG